VHYIPRHGRRAKKGGSKPKIGSVVIDGNIVTSRGPATTFLFALKLVEMLVGKEVAEKVRKETLVDMALKKF